MIKGKLNYKFEYNGDIIIQNFVIFAEDNFNFIFKFKKNISISNAVFCVIDLSNRIIIKKEYGDGIIQLKNNQYEINLTSNDTKNLYNKYYYKLIVESENENITIMIGKLDVLLTTNGNHIFSKASIPIMDVSMFAQKTIDTCNFNVKHIRSYAFYNCTNLALTSLPDGVTSIENFAFYNCTNLALTLLPNGVTSIGDSVFFDCTNLALTSLPDGVTSIGNSAFYNCINLALTSLPNGVTSIGDSVFYNCTNLALTSLPNGVTSIGVYAFYQCTNLTSLTFMGKPNSIAIDAFKGCTNLTNIYVPWSEGEVANAPWGATNATIHYNS